MLSLVAVKTLGVAKKVQPFVVRLPYHGPPDHLGVVGDQIFTPEDYIGGISKINDALGSISQPIARAVVLLADYYPTSVLPDGANDGFVTRMFSLLDDMASKGAIIVTGSGNIRDEKNNVLDGWPANFGKRNGGLTIPSLIVAGGVSSNSKKSHYLSDPEAGIPHVYAPVIRIKVAEGNDQLDNDYTNADGTSACKF